MSTFPITDRIFVGECPFDHVVVHTTEDAWTAYLQGRTILVPDFAMARLIMLRSGVTPEMADQRVTFSRANEGVALP